MIRRATTRGLALTLAFMALAAASAFTKADAVQRDVWPSQWAQEFEPKALYAEAGDTVKWWGLEKGHDVEGYAGAGYEKVASSGHIYSTTFGGGTVYYRCTLHSAWSWREKCTGMCGAITDRNSPPITPTIARPLSGDVNQNPVRISGQSDPWNFVAIYGTDGVELDRFLAKADGSWASWIRLPMGANTITAATINPDGSTSAKTSPRQINVTWPGDYTPPTGAFSASVSAHQGPVTILTGTAEDAVAVETIRIRIIKAGVYGSWPWAETRLFRNAEATCTNCPTTKAQWTLSLPLPPGYYEATITVWDTSGNSSVPPKLGVPIGGNYEPPNSGYRVRFVVTAS